MKAVKNTVKKLEEEANYLFLRAMFAGEEERERKIYPRLRQILDEYDKITIQKKEVELI
jgi:hypothetical protein